MLTEGTNHSSRYGTYYYNSGPLDINIGICLPLPPVGYVYIIMANGAVRLEPETKPLEPQQAVAYTTTANLVTAISRLANS